MENLTIHNLIIHEIKKEAKQTTAELIKSENSLNHTSLISDFISVIHESFSNSSIKNTKYADRNDVLFKSQFEKYTKNESTFIKYTTDSMIKLKSEIEKISFASGGYYVFSDYTKESNRYIFVIIIRKKDGYTFNMKNNTYQVNPQQNLNIDKLAMGARINYNIYSNSSDERNYLALVTNQKDKLSEYFTEWIGSEKGIKNEENTSNLVKVIKSIDTPIDENGLSMNRDVFQQSVFDYIESNPQKIIDLRDLGIHLYGEENRNKIINYATEKNIIIDTEFKRELKITKKLIKVRASINGILLIADNDKINDTEVQVLDDKIVIHSRTLADEIRRQR